VASAGARPAIEAQCKQRQAGVHSAAGAGQARQPLFPRPIYEQALQEPTDIAHRDVEDTGVQHFDKQPHRQDPGSPIRELARAHIVSGSVQLVNWQDSTGDRQWDEAEHPLPLQLKVAFDGVNRQNLNFTLFKNS
jgi:hypothetical protein